MLIHNKDDIEFDTDFPCLLGHPVPSCQTAENSLLKRIHCIDMNADYLKKNKSWLDGLIPLVHYSGDSVAQTPKTKCLYIMLNRILNQGTLVPKLTLGPFLTLKC